MAPKTRAESAPAPAPTPAPQTPVPPHGGVFRRVNGQLVAIQDEADDAGETAGGSDTASGAAA